MLHVLETGIGHSFSGFRLQSDWGVEARKRRRAQASSGG